MPNPDHSSSEEIDEVLEKLALQCNDHHDPAVLYNERHEIKEAKNQLLTLVDKQSKLATAKWIERYLLAWSGDLPFEALDSMRFQLRELKALKQSEGSK